MQVEEIFIWWKKNERKTGEFHYSITNLRNWRDYARECFCFGREAVNASGEAVRGLVKSQVQFPPAQIRGVLWIMRSPVDANFGLAESTEMSIKC